MLCDSLADSDCCDYFGVASHFREFHGLTPESDGSIAVKTHNNHYETPSGERPGDSPAHPSVPPAVAVAVAGAAAIAIGGPDLTTADISKTIISIKLKGARVNGQCIWQTSNPTISTT